MDNAVNDAVEIRARVDLVGDAGRDDREDVARARAASVEPREEPIFAAQNEPPELAFSSVVGGFDVSVFEKEQQSWPLAIQIPEPLAERCLGRNHGLLPLDPGAKLVENRPAGVVPSLAPLLGVVSGARRVTLDREQARDDAHALKG